LFSATIPAPIRRIASKHLRTPVEITIKSKTTTATNIRQRYWMVSGMHKLDALTRILEAETFDGMLVFTRTKQATVELAEKLEARGFAAAPLNGDIPQPQRERTVARLKAGQIDIVVATDVAARGLDVERIGHVVNYDVPYDTESYVHRIGRTGRAGRKGEAILFIAPRERNMLRAIERATRQVIEPMNLPTVDTVNALRITKFKQRVIETVPTGAAGAFRPILEQLEAETGLPLIDIAAALASLSQGTTPLLLAGKPERPAETYAPRAPAERPHAERAPAERAPSASGRAPAARAAPADADGTRKPKSKTAAAGLMETFRIEVGSVHGIKPGNIVGAIANEAGIEGVHIGRVDIREDHSYVDLPEGMPKQIFKELQKVRVVGRELRISRVGEKPPKPPRDSTGRHTERKMLSRRKTRN
jgi:ATP-dependent RNA helicase DeaD